MQYTILSLKVSKSQVSTTVRLSRRENDSLSGYHRRGQEFGHSHISRSSTANLQRLCETRQMLRGCLLVSVWELHRGLSPPSFSKCVCVCVCVCVMQVLAFYSLYEQCEQAVDNSENWLKVQAPPASEPEPLKVQLDRCRVSAAFPRGDSLLINITWRHSQPTLINIRVHTEFGSLIFCSVPRVLFIHYAYLCGLFESVCFHASVCGSTFLWVFFCYLFTKSTSDSMKCTDVWQIKERTSINERTSLTNAHASKQVQVVAVRLLGMQGAFELIVWRETSALNQICLQMSGRHQTHTSSAGDSVDTTAKEMWQAVLRKQTCERRDEMRRGIITVNERTKGGEEGIERSKQHRLRRGGD